MIIYKQSRQGFIVLDNFKEVCLKYIETDEDEDYKYSIYADNFLLGIYETEERCMQIIRKIVNDFKTNENNLIFTMPEK